MTDILQPDFTEVWADLDEQTKMSIFPHIAGDARRALLDISKETFDEASRAERVTKLAVDTLLYRDAKREADRLEAEREGAHDSWAEQDIDDLFDTEQLSPDIGSFAENDTSNGGGIFYSGKVNEIHGPSESGKTMVALAVAAQEIRTGSHVIMIDFEDDGRSIVNRLRYVFGLDRESIVQRFHYFRPDVAFSEKALEHISKVDGATMCIIDAVTEGMSIAQLDGRNENEVAHWYNTFPKKLANLGLGVVLVDHTPQDNHSRQIGSQHKKSAVDGVSYTAEPIAPFVKGQRGQLRLKVAKDKPSGVRVDALPQGDGKQYWRGDFRIDGRGAADSPRVELTGVDPHAFDIPNANTGQARDVHSVTLPTPAESQVLLILAEDAGWMSNDAIMKWHNDGLDPKDPGRMDRTAPRKRAVKLLSKGLAERRDSGSTVQYRITEEGKHSANVWVNRQSENPQMKIVELGFTTGSEPKSEPKGEPK